MNNDIEKVIENIERIKQAEWLSFCFYMRKRKMKKENQHYHYYQQTTRIIRLLKDVIK